MTLHDAQDCIVKDTVPDVRTGQKWDVAEEVKDMDSWLYYKDIVGASQAGRTGLVRKKHTFFNKASSFVKKKLVSDEIRTSQEEICQTKAAGFTQQAVWMKWESVEPRSLLWSEFCSVEPLDNQVSD